MPTVTAEIPTSLKIALDRRFAQPNPVGPVLPT
jgi:hypothetical protein